MIIHYDLVQHSDEWFAERLGVPSTSKFKDMMTNGRGSDSMGATAHTYAKELAIERVTGKVTERYVSADMERGTELEPVALAWYEESTLTPIRLIGGISNHGCFSSTDGLTESGVIEIKCPKHTTHFDYILDPDSLRKTYHAQVQGELWISERAEAILISYHPDFDDAQVVLRVERDEKYIKELQIRAAAFEETIRMYVDRFNQKFKK